MIKGVTLDARVSMYTSSESEFTLHVCVGMKIIKRLQARNGTPACLVITNSTELLNESSNCF